MTALNRIATAAWHTRAIRELRRLYLETDGQDMVEYALLTTFIGFAGAAGWSVMQTGLGNVYTGSVQAVWNSWEPANPVGAGS
jgi:Flp pilus assembly pilin Flp